ncbi:HNH endonuclease signature motif containing protein [Ralstonia pseudosolanacearum]|uniref:HNH endonuclease signature motif containing protein n=1 Tax=Ralstonia pseudosolanacearum TaxID=1310165 RepID=UPI003CEECBFC
MAERFWEKVEVQGADECWPWLASTKQGGYGKILGDNGRFLLAHRAAYQLAIGSIPENLVICHQCDNPNCVNPAHLFLGTQADNLRDMRAKGRGNPPKGRRHPNARLNDEIVAQIRADTRSHRQLALEYGIGKSTVGMIKSGATWTHL